MSALLARVRGGAFTLVIVGIASVLLFGMGIAAASIPDSGGVIHACYKTTTNGPTRIVNSASDCNPSETPIQWNQAGVPGPPGAPGAPGAPGTNGSSFLAGSSGGELSNGNNGGGCGGFIGVGACAFSQDVVEQVVPIGGTLKSLYVHLSAAPGVGVHEHWQINVNNAGTFLACDIDGTATTCNNTADTFPVSAGDTVTLEASETTIGGASPAAVTWGVQIG